MPHYFRCELTRSVLRPIQQTATVTVAVTEASEEAVRQEVQRLLASCTREDEIEWQDNENYWGFDDEEDEEPEIDEFEEVEGDGAARLPAP